MDDDIDKIQQNPACLIVARSAKAHQAPFSGCLTDLIRDGPHLSVARAGSNYKIVGSGRFAPQVQNYNIITVPFIRYLSGS